MFSVELTRSQQEEVSALTTTMTRLAETSNVLRTLLTTTRNRVETSNLLVITTAKSKLYRLGRTMFKK